MKAFWTDPTRNIHDIHTIGGRIVSYSARVRQERTSRRVFLFGAGAAALTASYSVFIERYLVQVNRYDVFVSNLPPAFVGYQIAHLTDTHLGWMTSTKFLNEVVDIANDVGADLIVGTGDFVHRQPEEVGAVWPLLKRLRARDGVCCVLGNHDHWADERESLSRLESSGFSVRHSVVPLVRNGQRLLVLGAGDHMEDRFGLNDLLQAARPEDCRIVLAHNPDAADQPRGGRIDLMLSGHTHGGQIRIPGYGAPILPVHNKAYDQGLKTVGDMSLFISRGVGCVAIPARFASPPEVAVLRLTDERSTGATA